MTPARSQQIVEAVLNTVRSKVYYQMMYRQHRAIPDRDLLTVSATDENAVTQITVMYDVKGDNRGWYSKGPFARYEIEVNPMLVDRGWTAAGSHTIDGMLIIGAREVGWMGGHSVREPIYELSVLKVHYGLRGIGMEIRFLTRTASGQRILAKTLAAAKGQKTLWDRHVGDEDFASRSVLRREAGHHDPARQSLSDARALQNR
ncbi:hypothetical protein [Aureimonas glaciei]|uniref:Uncharacterized protein n=1 Tax=Aureimonas glaciei TaxID=1776957 RepID=A0A916Y5M0_9HYPH|nr:hypothetical protein [Aureimonas glaciei]GGD31463.1 hypothetical protein GCM10011335_38120 [Aureimonas glaciei]